MSYKMISHKYIEKIHLSNKGYSFMHNEVYNLFNLKKSKGTLICDEKQNPIATYLPRYFGEKISSLDLLRDDIDLNGLMHLIKRKSKDTESYIVIRNLKKYRNVRDYCEGGFDKAKEMYPSENSYPHIVYNLDDNALSGRYIQIGEIIIPYSLSSEMSRYRYDAKRVKRVFQDVKKNEVTAEVFNIIVKEWKDKYLQDKPKMSIHEISDFYRYWLNPISEFWDFIVKHDADYNIQKYALTTVSGNCGLWIGHIQENCLYVDILLTSRKSAIFADLLLMSIISHAIINSIKYVSLGGSEKQSLYNYKKKYISAFKKSKNEKLFDLLVKSK